MQTGLEKHLSALRDRLSQSQRAESLYVCTHCGRPSDGYSFLKEELDKVLAAFKLTAVSPKSLDNPLLHASTVGGHNAIQSLLGTIEARAKAAPKLSAQVIQVEQDNAEELQRLGE